LRVGARNDEQEVDLHNLLRLLHRHHSHILEMMPFLIRKTTRLFKLLNGTFNCKVNLIDMLNSI